MLDFDTLRIIWWVLLGILIIGFAIMDGFDFGVAILLPLITENEIERRIVLDTILPFWEGNQVWIILGAGAIFAAWPIVYAVTFSSFYYLILLLLLSMGISRPVSFKYRSKLPNHFWRRFWDGIVFFGGFVPAILFGILISNVITGFPFQFDHDLRLTVDSSWLDYLHPFSLWCAVTSLAMLIMHGGLYLAIKTNDPIRERAIAWSRTMALILIVLFAGGGLWIAFVLPGYSVSSPILINSFSNPLHKEVILDQGAWMNNYHTHPLTMLVPCLGLLGAALAFVTANWGNSKLAFFCSSLSIAGIIGTVGVSLFPFILPSSSDLASSLLVWDASSSQNTLFIMLIATVIFIPIILSYTSWVYYVLRGKVNKKRVEEDEKH